MLLAKSCHSKDHIRARNTLKLGTLFEYRAIEIKEIADADEGTYIFSLNFQGTVRVDIAWYNLLMGNAIRIQISEDDAHPVQFPGRTEAHFLRVNQRVNGGRTVELTDSTALVKREVLNSFIFCMSQVRRTGEAAGIFPHYDAHWFLHSQRADFFAKRLGQLLLREIGRKRETGQHIVPEHLELDKLGVKIQHGMVTYAPRALIFRNGCDLSVDRLMPLLSSMAFLKTPDFTPEKEYRFHFTLIHEDRIIEPLTKNIIITDVDDLAALII
ncbi:hypothetical protein [Pseudomonas monteilii]|uniref:hypothetical protein n=1 Tax=Pseudomonas monteilii TaxID=76759 RepID=UPI001CBE980C|nr:hypothetical protein [Pseudomonas monteilii]MBZ3664928.1 hypothetical protein [Pseudomonas monteilii]MBZ3670273.1 hypothetical protein [Pseudomonas monteilii]